MLVPEPTLVSSVIAGWLLFWTIIGGMRTRDA
jgi:hypothetical protein